MKRILPILALLLCVGAVSAQNPFEKFGYTPKIGTLSKGKYIEHFDTDSIVQIGSVLFNPFTKKITGFVVQETVYSEATLQPEIVSRWLTPDPLSDEFPQWSPYVFTNDNPIVYTDPLGLAPETIFKNMETGETVEVNDGIDKTIEVNTADFEKAKFFASAINPNPDEDGLVNLGVDEAIIDSYTAFYNEKNSYEEFSLANAIDYLFTKPKIKSNNIEPIGSAGALEYVTMGGTGVVLKGLGLGIGKSSSRLFKFAGDEAAIHFGKHGNSIMKALGKSSYNLKNYVDDASHVLNTGTFAPELNGYVRLIGGKGSAKYGFVGLNRSTGNITTFHVKTAKELSKKAPSLGIKY